VFTGWRCYEIRIERPAYSGCFRSLDSFWRVQFHRRPPDGSGDRAVLERSAALRTVQSAAVWSHAAAAHAAAKEPLPSVPSCGAWPYNPKNAFLRATVSPWFISHQRWGVVSCPVPFNNPLTNRK